MLVRRRLVTVCAAAAAVLLGGLGATSSSVATPAVLAVPAVETPDPVAMVQPGTNPAIPAEGLAAGQVVVLVDGVEQPGIVTRQRTRMTVRLAGMPPLRLRGTRVPTNPDRGYYGAGLPLTADGALSLRPGGLLDAGADVGSYRPGTSVRVYLSGEPEPLADMVADDEGGFSGLPVIGIPTSARPGLHLLQVNAVLPDDRVISVSLGVMVAVDQAPEPALRWPTKVKDRGTTRLFRLPIRTDAGQPVQVSVECWDFGSTELPPRVCRSVTLDSGWVGVWQSGRRDTRVFVDVSAPEAYGVLPLHRLRVYLTERAR